MKRIKVIKSYNLMKKYGPTLIMSVKVFKIKVRL